MNVARTAPLGYRTPNEYTGSQSDRFDGAPRPQNPAPLAVAGVQGELLINATMWQLNENIKEPAELQL